MIDEKYYKAFYPKQLILLTTGDKEGRPNVATIAWHMPASIEPPMIAIAIGKSRHSKKLIEATGEFVLNIATEDLKAAVKLCGSVSGRRNDKFSQAKLTPEPSAVVRPPSIKECPVSVECKVAATYDASDHIIYVGEVVHVRKAEETPETPRKKVLVEAEDEYFGFEKV
ncbi:MAG: flavin reductase family protein [Candidatus Micrarchaeia archaeon]